MGGQTGGREGDWDGGRREEGTKKEEVKRRYEFAADKRRSRGFRR
jgi:hypothetical protein